MPSDLTSLLSRLKDWRDDASWREFYNTYWKLVHGVAIKSGLTPQEAEEVVQETLITVARRIPEFRYDPAVCSFKTWLLNLTRWRIVDQIRKRRVHTAPSSNPRHDTRRTATIEQAADPATQNLDVVWDAEWEQQLLDAAIQRVKQKVNPEHYQIFHLSVFKEWPVQKIARELDTSAAQVYLARHRVGALLKKEVRAIEKRMNAQAS
jgi:RNA polymerase sigma-70 factor (ECF subfamily)